MGIEYYEREEAKRALRLLARRREVFVAERKLFAAPGWTIMLHLFANVAADGSATVSECMAAAAASNATTIRHLADLERAGLVASGVSASDRRSRLIALTPLGRKRLSQTLRGLGK